MKDLNRAYEILKEYMFEYKFSFSEDEIIRQFPEEMIKRRFKI